MEYDNNKIDDTILALMYLTTRQEKIIDDLYAYRTWKGYDRDALNRLYDKGLINNPVSKAKSVLLTEEGRKKSEELFNKFFSK
jgi:hypothetical protein